MKLELPPLPKPQHPGSNMPIRDPASGWSYIPTNAWSESQMREYGIACARAALTAALQEADEVVAKLRALHRATMDYEDACVLRGAELCAEAIRALAVGSGGSGA